MKEYRIQEYKEAKEIIKTFMTNKKEYAIVHYACQNFTDVECESSPRITAICVMLTKSKQIELFSLASVAERKSFNISSILDQDLDILELEMLQEFYGFLKGLNRQIPTFFHWNMKDRNYGFSAIAQRYKKLKKCKKTPVQIDENKKINISELLHKRYGDNYAPHRRLPKLMEMNEINPPLYLDGKEEATAFINRQWVRIDKSVQAKVQVFFEILDKMGNNELKTNGKILRDIYGISLGGVLMYVKENAVFGAFSSLIGGIVVNVLYDLVKLMFA